MRKREKKKRNRLRKGNILPLLSLSTLILPLLSLSNLPLHALFPKPELALESERKKKKQKKGVGKKRIMLFESFFFLSSLCSSFVLFSLLLSLLLSPSLQSHYLSSSSSSLSLSLSFTHTLSLRFLESPSTLCVLFLSLVFRRRFPPSLPSRRFLSFSTLVTFPIPCARHGKIAAHKTSFLS